MLFRSEWTFKRSKPIASFFGNCFSRGLIWYVSVSDWFCSRHIVCFAVHYHLYLTFCSALSLVVNVLQCIIVCGQRLAFVCVQHCAFRIVHSAVANRLFEPRLSYHKPVEPLTPENYPLRPPNDLQKSPRFEPGEIFLPMKSNQICIAVRGLEAIRRPQMVQQALSVDRVVKTNSFRSFLTRMLDFSSSKTN